MLAGQKVKDVSINRKLKQIEFENNYRETVKNVRKQVIDIESENIKESYLEERHNYISNYYKDHQK